jgi:hypothetical protein
MFRFLPQSPQPFLLKIDFVCASKWHVLAWKGKCCATFVAFVLFLFFLVVLYANHSFFVFFCFFHISILFIIAFEKDPKTGKLPLWSYILWSGFHVPTYICELVFAIPMLFLHYLIFFCLCLSIYIYLSILKLWDHTNKSNHTPTKFVT